ncbi:MAG: hypothetical protein KGJ86_16130, partial [Chloroflexota bacterium]|nr:hypothetical protein [Chloroflexota bacterium]
MPKSPSNQAVATMADLAGCLTSRIDELSERLVDRILTTDEVYREAGIVPREQLRQATHDNLLEHLTALSILPSRDDGLRASARATARRRAEQGLPLENLLRAYRLGGRIVWEGLLEECRARPNPPKDELMEAAVLVWDTTDEYSAEITRTYRKAEDEILSRDKSQRQTLLRGLLTGMATDRDLAMAGKVLDLPNTGPYLVALADIQDETSAAVR